MTDTQLVLLSAASQREDGGIELGATSRAGPRPQGGRQTPEPRVDRSNPGPRRAAGVTWQLIVRMRPFHLT